MGANGLILFIFYFGHINKESIVALHFNFFHSNKNSPTAANGVLVVGSHAAFRFPSPEQLLDLSGIIRRLLVYHREHTYWKLKGSALLEED